MTGKQVTAKSTLGVKVKGTPKDGLNVQVKTEDAIRKIFRTEHDELAEALLRHCFKALGNSEVSDDTAGNDERAFMVSVVAEISPRDTVERMLAVQMAATHVAMVRSGGMLGNASFLPQLKAHYSGFNVLARTYAAQMEALRKHRDGGKQVVRVQHVNVEGGGQAIVGNVQTGERADTK